MDGKIIMNQIYLVNINIIIDIVVVIITYYY